MRSLLSNFGNYQSIFCHRSLLLIQPPLNHPYLPTPTSSVCLFTTTPIYIDPPPLLTPLPIPYHWPLPTRPTLSLPTHPYSYLPAQSLPTLPNPCPPLSPPTYPDTYLLPATDQLLIFLSATEYIPSRTIIQPWWVSSSSSLLSLSSSAFSRWDNSRTPWAIKLIFCMVTYHDYVLWIRIREPI